MRFGSCGHRNALIEKAWEDAVHQALPTGQGEETDDSAHLKTEQSITRKYYAHM